MAEIAVLKTNIVNYAKIREVYIAYCKVGYSKKFLAEHEGDILLHKAAKKTFDELGVKKLSTVKSLQGGYTALLVGKKTLYPDYSAARKEIRDLTTAKANVDRLLGRETDKAQERPPARRPHYRAASFRSREAVRHRQSVPQGRAAAV